MKIHELHPSEGARKKKKRVGRGNASGKGTYSARGIKGQKSRTGGRKGLILKGLRKTIKRIPKKRGFKSLKPSWDIVTLKTLDHYFDNGEIITIERLKEKSIIGRIKKGVKIIGKEAIKKKFQLEVHAISEGARKVIESHGGEIKLL